jgi:hypothetical protein
MSELEDVNGVLGRRILDHTVVDELREICKNTGGSATQCGI